MNKQELIERIDKLPYFEGPIADTVTVNREWILKSIEQLDEPQKVTIPQFVADWIEYFKNCKGTLYGSTNPFSYYGRAILEDFEGDYEEVLRWIRDNSDTYARAWLDGYTVEKEKLYTVKIRGFAECGDYFNYFVEAGYWAFSGPSNHPNVRTYHTRKELEEADFGWVFDCEGIEIEEVE